ncbi:hypothetical protein JCM8547_006260 [Rhodosporidiobolus lusitaniae]
MGAVGEEEEDHNDEEIAKPVNWDVAVLALLIKNLHKPLVLWIRLDSLKKLSAEVFSSSNLITPEILELPVPLTTNEDLVPSFHLRTLILNDHVPIPNKKGECGLLHVCCVCGSQSHAAVDCPLSRWGLPGDWTSTIRFLSPALSDLQCLNLRDFPYFSLYVKLLLPSLQNPQALLLPDVSAALAGE